MAISEAKVRNKMAKPKDTLPGTMGKWLMAHPDALEEVKVWMQMAKAGETEWTMTRLHLELRSEHGFPFTATCNFGRFLSATFPDEYPRKR